MPTLHALPAFEDNYIWVLAGGDGCALIVDPGDARPVLAAQRQGLRPAAILLTHHHPDHIGGAAELVERLGIPCIGPEDERIPMATGHVADGDRIRIDALGLQFDVLSVPGHTRTHVAYHGHVHLFCGDTLFSLGCGRLFEGSPPQMLDSLDKLSNLPEDTLVCCAHEYTLSNARFALAVDPRNSALLARIDEARAQRAAGHPTLPTTLGNELRCNPFLRCDSPDIRQSVAEHARHMPRDRVETFSLLRRWKDGFRG